MTRGMNIIIIPSTYRVLWEGCHASKRPSTVLSKRATGGYLGGQYHHRQHCPHARALVQRKYGPMYCWST
eukprot:2218532-Pyramimonas_sp.AAC.1